MNGEFVNDEWKQGSIWFINNQGEEIVKLRNDVYVYSRVSAFSNGFLMVSNDKKYGYINREGDLAVPCIYDEVKPFR